MNRMLFCSAALIVAVLARGVAAALPEASGGLRAGCPAVAPAFAAPAGSAGRLVRPGARSLLLCRYQGLNPAATARRLRSSRQVTARREIAALAGELSALPPLSGLVSCPFDDGSEIVASFGYEGGGDAVVQIGLTGCRAVRGSRPPVRTASGERGQRLLAQLAVLVR